MSNATAVFHGVEIPETLLATEMQNHQAATISEARLMAGRALAAKAVLLNRAVELGLSAEPERNARGQEETLDEALVRAVLSKEVNVIPPSETELRKIYDDRPNGFTTSPLLEASHILIAPEEDTPEAVASAKSRAEAIIALLRDQPERFVRIAAGESACPSASEGGALGQLNSGDVLDDVWTALIELEAGEISRQPVRTEYGWHVLRLDHRADGARLPFEHVREHISARLEARAWTLEAARFVDGLLLQSTSHPCLKLTAEATLDDGESETTRAADLLGAALADEVMALESLTEHGRERVAADAKRRGEPPERVLTQAIGTFLTSADDEGWTSLISRLRDSDTPLADCLDLIVAHQLPPITAKRTLILTPGGRGGAPELKGQSNGTGK